MKTNLPIKIKFHPKLKILPAAIFAAGFAISLLTFPQLTGQGVRNGLSLCAQVVIPSLFPFMVLSCFLVKSGLCSAAGSYIEPVTRRLFRLPGAAGGAILMSLIGGFPVGAKMTAQLFEDGEFSSSQATRMFMFCVNAGPAFVIGAVGSSMLGSRKAGFLLYMSLCAASLTVGFLTRFIAEENCSGEMPAVQRRIANPSLQASVVESVADASAAILSVCSWIILFACLCSLLELVPAGEGFSIPAKCLLEVTIGCSACAGKVSLPVIAAVLGWSGLSVHCQVLPFTRKSEMKFSLFMAARAVNGALAALIAHELFQFFPCEINVFSNHIIPVAAPYSVSVPAAAALLLMGALLILDLDTGKKVC